MIKEEKKAESVKVKRFAVVVDKIAVLNTSKKDEADSKIIRLQSELIPLIILLDNQDKKSFRFSKTVHQNNYRIQAGNFEEDSKTKSVIESTETQE